MKTITTIGAILLTTILSVHAADTLKATSFTTGSTGTTVQVERVKDDMVLFTGSFVFAGSPTAQQIVDKLSYRCDSQVTASSNFGVSTPKTGQVESLAQMRASAYTANGLTGYFTELARQVLLEI